MPLGAHWPGPSWPGALLSRGSAFFTSTWTKGQGGHIWQHQYKVHKVPHLDRPVLTLIMYVLIGQVWNLSLYVYQINKGRLCKLILLCSQESCTAMCLRYWSSSGNFTVISKWYKSFWNHLQITASSNVPEKHRFLSFLKWTALYNVR